MKEYKLVKYEDKDHDEYIKCQTEAFKKYIIEFFGGFNVDVMEGHLADILKFDLYKIIVENELAGFIYFKEEDEKITLDVFTILPKFRNCGLGSQILQDFIKLANTKNKTINLDTFKTNPAKVFYERNGFVVTGENNSHFILEYTPNLEQIKG